MSRCRFCEHNLNKIFVDLGASPLSNSFLTKDLLEKKEPIYPLKVYVCENCLLVQLEEFESPDKIFGHYAYFSSFSESWLLHAQKFVEMMVKRFDYNKENLIVEIASNDGYLLQYFKEKDIPVLGIEPASNVAKVSLEKGIPTIVEFFNTKTAKELIEKGKNADLIIGNNVLAHVPNLNDFVAALKILLKNNGIITLEFPHIFQLIKNNQFDTIYHEHFSYFSLYTVEKIFEKHDLVIFDAEEIDTHGGSLRIFVKHKESNLRDKTTEIQRILQKEKEFGLREMSGYLSFKKQVENVKIKLNGFLNEIHKEGKKIVAYGAAAKGNTLLNYCQISNNLIDYVVDRSTFKQGLFLPGTHIPIFSPEKIQETKPEYVLILPWNLKDEIMKQMSYISEWNGKFVVPIPEVRVLS